MPYLWLHHKVAVEVEELVPTFWNVLKSLQSEISRYRDKPYGIKKLQSGGNGRRLLIDFDTLPAGIQQALGDPRKYGHLLEKYYQTQDETLRYYAQYKRGEKHLSDEEQRQYVINATTWQALIRLETRALNIRNGMNKKNPERGLANDLLSHAQSFNDTLPPSQKHNLPTNLKRFKQGFKAFKTDGLFSVIKDPHGKGKQNSRKVDEQVLMILQGLFVGQKHKPTPTEIHQQYRAFLSGYVELYNQETGELFEPKNFPELSERTITSYLMSWENKIGSYQLRSGNRQTYKGAFIPHSQTALPEFAGSLLSIDDRQPPFWYEKGKRLWFYIGIDVASRCITCFVYGKTKEGIILEFYRQLVRNYHEWGLSLPYELECESSLNSSFTETFLKEGYMFQSVRMEANNAQGKYIERMFGKLRNQKEKKSEGWIARPHAKNEAYQTGKEKTKIIPYKELVQARLADIEDWNNEPHDEKKQISRWEYFLNNQKTDLPSMNYRAILPHLGYKQTTSCRRGYINLQGKKRAIAEGGKILTGDALIEKMKQIEGKEFDVFWLDDNQGNVLKAIAYQNGRYVCEVQEMPRFQRAKAEQTEQDMLNKALQDAYAMTIVRFAEKQSKSVENIGVIRIAPQPQRKFIIPELKRFTPSDDFYQEQESVEILDNEDDFEILYNPSTGIEHTKNWNKKYAI